MNEEAKKQSPEPVLPETSKCKYCKKEIEPDASKCPHCNEYQNKLRLLVFLPYVIPSVIVLVSIAQVILAYVQAQETHRKYIDASDTLNKIVKAERDINSIRDETEVKLVELNRFIEDGNRAVAELKLLT
jgi:hypothetical protein